MYWFAHRESYVSYETMMERMIDWNSTFCNVYEDVNNSSSLYMRMMMDTMKQAYQGECSSIVKELNAI